MGKVKQIEVFWFMSLLGPAQGGSMYYRRTGIFTVAAGETRFACFEEIFAAVKAQSPELGDAVVLSFDIQPNQLTA
jgi:hypothetical protein